MALKQIYEKSFGIKNWFDTSLTSAGWFSDDFYDGSGVTPVQVTKQLIYTVKATPTALTKSLQYSIISVSTVSITKTLTYLVRKIQSITKSLTYKPNVRYWVGGTGDWSDTAHWSETSGGTSGASVPTTSTNVIFDANSFSANGQTVTIGTVARAYANRFDMTGVTENITINTVNDEGIDVYGDFILCPTVTMTYSGGLYSLNLYGNTGTSYINTYGIDLGAFIGINLPAGGTYELLSDFVSTGGLSQLDFGGADSGIFTTNNHNITVQDFGGWNTIFNLGSSTINVTHNFGFSAPATFNSNTATIKMINSSGLGHSISFDNSITGAPYKLWNSDTSAETNLDGSGLAFNTIKFDPDTTTYIYSAYSLVATNWQISGTLGHLVTILSITGGTQYTLSKSSGTITADYLNITDSIVGGGATWIAGTGFVDGGNNDGWLFPGIQITKSLGYTIKRTQTPITKSLKYTVRKTVTALTKSLAYYIRKGISLNKSLAYSTKKNISVSKTLKYTVRRPATAITKSLQYTVKRSINAITKSLQYTIKRPASAITKGLIYTIKKPVAITKSLKYTVKKTATAITKSLVYDIRRSSSITKTLVYDIRRGVSITKSLQYNAVVPAVPVLITKSLKYTIRKPVSAITKSLQYAVRKTATAITKTLTYRIVKAQSAITKQLKYIVKSPVAITKVLTYQVKKSAVISKALTYDVRNIKQITKSLTYRVIRNSAVQKSLIYTMLATARPGNPQLLTSRQQFTTLKNDDHTLKLTEVKQEVSLKANGNVTILK